MVASRAIVILEGLAFYLWFTYWPLNDKESRWLIFNIKVEGFWIDGGYANYCLLVVRLILCRLVEFDSRVEFAFEQYWKLLLIMMESGWMKVHIHILTSGPFTLFQCSQSGWHQKFYGMSSLMKSINTCILLIIHIKFWITVSTMNFISIGKGDKMTQLALYFLMYVGIIVV